MIISQFTWPPRNLKYKRRTWPPRNLKYKRRLPHLKKYTCMEIRILANMYESIIQAAVYIRISS